MEADPSFKQIIPYLVLRDGDRYFLMRRTRAGGDARLRDLRTVIDAWLAELERPEGPDSTALAARFTAARRRLEDDS